MRLRLFVLTLGLCVAGPAAASGRALLQRGVALYREAAYAPAVAALEQARLSDELQAPERAECAFYLAAGYVALGSPAAARRELGALLDVAPEYELPAFTSPKVAALFRDVMLERERAPRLVALPPRRAAGAVELRFEPARTGGESFGAAWWRWRGERDFREAPLGHAPAPAAGRERLWARIAVEHGGTIEYYAVVRGAAGRAEAGTRDRPLELPVPPGP
jgi:hypothetical protein